MKNTTIITAVALIALAPFAIFAKENSAVPATHEKAAEPAAKTSTPAGWLDDFEAAKKQANAEGKDLLVAFSGSDWCGWCVRLEQEIFSQDGFTEKLYENFVPVYIDNPNDSNRLSEVAKKQNRPLTERYRIEGFPTVLLMDADGDVFAETGYQSGGPEKYLESLGKLKSEGKANPEYQAQKALRNIPKGQDRAKRLHEVLVTFPLDVQITNQDYVLEVLEADPDGSLGYRAKYPYFTTVLPLENELQIEMARLSKLSDEAIKDQGSPEDKDKRRQIIISVLSENSEKLASIRERAQRAKERFAENVAADRRISGLIRQINYMFKYYIKPKPESSAGPSK